MVQKKKTPSPGDEDFNEDEFQDEPVKEEIKEEDDEWVDDDYDDSDFDIPEEEEGDDEDEEENENYSDSDWNAPDKEEEYVEEEDDWEDDEPEFVEKIFVCRMCKEKTELGEGDDHLIICLKCEDKYSKAVEKVWDNYDAGKITDEELKTVDLKTYK